MSGRRRFHFSFSSFSVIKNDAFKDMFPAYREECLTDKRTHFQCFVVFGKKIEDRFFNFEGEYDGRHEN